MRTVTPTDGRRAVFLPTRYRVKYATIRTRSIGLSATAQNSSSIRTDPAVHASALLSILIKRPLPVEPRDVDSPAIPLSPRSGLGLSYAAPSRPELRQT